MLQTDRKTEKEIKYSSGTLKKNKEIEYTKRLVTECVHTQCQDPGVNNIVLMSP